MGMNGGDECWSILKLNIRFNSTVWSDILTRVHGTVFRQTVSPTEWIAVTYPQSRILFR